MSIITYTLWQDNAMELSNKYKKKYFTPERRPELGDPLVDLVALTGFPKFFGTKTCNIFIVGIPFGWKRSGEDWVSDWTPTGYTDSKQRHKDTFKYFSKYETHVYMDFNIVDKVMAENPDSRFRELMEGTKGHMQEMCDDLAAFGFKLEADITGDVTAAHFYDILDPFYAS